VENEFDVVITNIILLGFLRHGVFDEKTREVQMNRAKKFSVNQHLIYQYN